ncbi:MAG: PEP-CTERM sorting domain-containing protein [Sedimentisphaerales bacterium]|nr:PEP-CTERM sorting domain-containing protein [Sedimentisphaerales bacterium]
MRIFGILAAVLFLFLAVGVAGASDDVDYSGVNKFVINSALSKFNIAVDIRDSGGVSLGGGSDNNIPLTGSIDATVTQSGTNGVSLDAIRIDDLLLQTTEGINMNFGGPMGTDVSVSSGTLSVVDNGPSGTCSISGGAFNVPSYPVVVNGIVNWSVYGYFGLINESGSINMGSFGAQTINNVGGTLTHYGSDLKLTGDLLMTVSQPQEVPLVGTVNIVTTISGHFEGFAPFQEVPEPVTMLTLLVGGVGVLRRRRS